MLMVYNLLHIVLLILFFPLIGIYIALKAKYRKHIPKRLGFGLKKKLSQLKTGKRTIWIHALSVGEVTSALPLVAALRKELDDTVLIFSAATRTGYELSQKLLSPYCDRIIVFPIDISPICSYFIESITPDLFILVETDFWPNFLRQLENRAVPAILVNGRISRRSMARYRRYSFFFRPMFQSFLSLCVQTDADRRRFLDFGIEEEKILHFGNLKFESLTPPNRDVAARLLKKNKQLLLIAGSTHPGEETFLLDAFLELRKGHDFKMIIAPRNPQRADEIASLAKSLHLDVQLRSSDEALSGDLYILDTIGELVSFYGEGDICFVGGSLVPAGGHNPLEPAAQGKPVIFGPYMDDFEEISQELIASGGGFSLPDRKDIVAVLGTLLQDPDLRLQSGNAALECIMRNQGVVKKHLEFIKEII
jgi:3-deoxy-D-manno-octulosonic-acid transferase